MTHPSIILISRNFPPLVGGMERLNQHVLQELAAAYPCHLIGPDGAQDFAPAPAKVVQCPARPIFLFLIHALVKSTWLALRQRPALVVAGSGLNAWPAWVAARLSGARLVVYLHGLDIVVNSFWYQRFFLPIIRRADTWLVNSHATAHQAIAAGIDPQRIHVLHPGVELPETLPTPEALITWRAKWQLEGKPIMLSVGRLTRRKGLAEFILHALPNILAQNDNAMLVVVGEEPSAAVSAKTSMQSVLTAIREAGVGNNVVFHGKQPDAELRLAYAAADVLIFPVLDIPGDMEGFGMVAVEAAAYGTPTVAFAVGGVPDAIANGQSGTLIDPENYPAFTEAVSVYLRQPKHTHQSDACRRHADRFAWPLFGNRIRSIVADIVPDGRK